MWNTREESRLRTEGARIKERPLSYAAWESRDLEPSYIGTETV